MYNKSLNQINNEIKSYVNEACGISEKCKRKLIKIVEKNFYVDLPDDNFLNIDISILENGNIVMRDDEYKSEKPISTYSELLERYNEFKKEIEELLEKKQIDFDTKKRNSEISNLLFLLLIFLLSIVIILIGINRLIIGDFFGLVWLGCIIFYYIIPASGNKLRNRIVRAKKYISKKFTKK